MSRVGLRLHLLTIAVAVSYITLGLADTREAERLWAPYAVITLLLALVNILTEGGGRRGR